MQAGRVLGKEIRRAIKEPKRLKKLLSPRSLRMLLAKASTPRFEWGDGDVRGRNYGSYSEYVEHQASKRGKLDLSEYDQRFRAALVDRIGDDLPGKTVICLGARSGAEVQAFIDRGAFAIGVDLNPTEGNRFVVTGDFHDLQWPDSTVDVVYSNSFDHAFDMDRLSREIWRVLRPGGLLLTEVNPGVDEGLEYDEWTASTWATVDDLAALFVGHGFQLEGKDPITVPWTGTQLALRKP